MLIDIYALMDDAPIILKRPLLPYTLNSFRIPLFVKYDPKIANWPQFAYYPTENTNIHGVLIGGVKSVFTESHIPNIGQYSIHVIKENGSTIFIQQGDLPPKDAVITWLCIAFNKESLYPYERIEVIATSQASISLYGKRDPDGDPNPPMLLKVPEIQQKADALKYAKWAFQKISVEVIKEKQTIFLYGGEIILSMRFSENNEIKNYSLGRFIMNNIQYDDKTVKIDGIDFRYVLNKKYPIIKFLIGRTELDDQAVKYNNSYFPKTGVSLKTENGKTFNPFIYGLPFLEDEYIDKIIPECIGIGNGIPGICLNGKQIYDETQFPDLIKTTEYIFQFPIGWTKLLKIEAYMDGNVIGNKTATGWTEIYPGLGNPNLRNGTGAYQTENKDSSGNWRVITDSVTGLVKVNYLQALQNGEYGNTPNKLRMFAEWPNKNMKAAINFLMKLSKDETLVLSNDSELNGLADIGLYLDKSDPIFNWIEQLQSCNKLSGQLALIDDVMKFRLENPNREKKLDISETDVLNHETLSVGLATDLLFSGYDITYKKSYSDNDTNDGHLIGENERYPTAEIYTGNDLTVNFIRDNDLEKRREQHYDTSSVQERANILNDLIKTFRHKIDGVEVPILQAYMNLFFYDVIGYIPKQLENTKIDYEWIVYNKKVNIQKETISFDLIERVKTKLWNNGNS
jgi:hypothetical protein